MIRAILRALVGRRSTLAQPSEWLVAGRTASGVAVNESSALGISAVWAAVRVISESVASLPLVLYERLERGKRRAHGHPVYALLHDAPNPDMTSYQWRETLQAHVCTWGNAYCEIVRDANGVPTALWPILPDRVEVRLRDGRPEYVVAGKTVLRPADVLHVAGLGFDGVVGYSPVRVARESLGLAGAAERFGASFFANAAMPGGVLEHPGVLSDEGYERLRKGWEDLHRGAARAGGLAILEQGMTYRPLSMPNDDAQWLQTRQFQVAEVARWFRLPPHMLGDLSRSTYSNIEAQQSSYYRDSLLPHLVRWEQELRRKLLPPGSELHAEFVVDGLLRAETGTRYQAYHIGRQGGWLSVNDIRERENMNPIEGGDRYLEPLNMQSAADAAAPKPANDEDPALAPDERALLAEARERLAPVPVQERGVDASPPMDELRAIAERTGAPLDELVARWSPAADCGPAPDPDRAFMAALERLVG